MCGGLHTAHLPKWEAGNNMMPPKTQNPIPIIIVKVNLEEEIRCNRKEITEGWDGSKDVEGSKSERRERG